jgi:predicted esterase
VKSLAIRRLAGLVLVVCSLHFAGAVRADDKDNWWTDEVEQALKKAGKNRDELEKALNRTPEGQRKAMTFLVANMPDRDLKALKADFLLENVDLAYKARKQVAWGDKIPDEIFFNDVLAYSNVDEARDAWRKELYELCLPIVKDCKTPAEAAHKLNSTIYEKLKVRYSTQRKQPHQSPKESMESGLASCTGLSILLSDACRSVSIPARLAGTPLWVDKSGNHTWVEIWDDGWHFTGACEPDPKGLDRGWFVGKAAMAKKDVPENAIYAASFRKTKTSFPLVWAPDRKDVFAENVTERYAKADKPSLTNEQTEQIEKEATAFFKASDEDRAKMKFDAALDKLVAEREDAVRAAVWKAYQAAPLHEKSKKDFEDKKVRFKEYVSAYVVREVGKKPEKGWPLVIAMHGGGGAPKEVNDQQWEQMQRYYKDHAEITGYKYLALRAPNDTWNGFYDNYVPPLIVNLIGQFALFGDIDPNKIFLIGYSHGGYGAFFIGPKIPDRFAAIHSSAAAPTDGTISALSLRNTRFTFMVGDQDTAYGRRERCEKFDKEIQKLKDDNKGEFPVEFELKKGFQHSNLPDRDYLKEMLTYTRNVIPRHQTWEPTDSVVTDFFSLSIAKPEKGQSVDAVIGDNTAIITTRKVKEFDLNLDGRLVATSKPLKVTLDGKTQTIELRPQFATLCQALVQRGDPALAYTVRVHLDTEKKAD